MWEVLNTRYDWSGMVPFMIIDSQPVRSFTYIIKKLIYYNSVVCLMWVVLNTGWKRSGMVIFVIIDTPFEASPVSDIINKLKY